MRASKCFALVVFLCAGVGLYGCGTGSELESSSDTLISHEEDTGMGAISADDMNELVPVEMESGGVTAMACTHNSTQYVRNGCCTQTATKFQQQICIYGTWYWQTPYRCEYPTSYCLP